jgi:hypothetical protein
MEDIAIATSPDDIAYVRASYVDAAGIAAGRCSVDRILALAGTMLPRASYALPDGTQWFPRDWWRLCDDAGSPDRVHEIFAIRYRAACRAVGREGDVDGNWAAYLAGLYGACLRDVTPEGIVWKERLVDRLDRTLAACDRIRFGRPTSRDRLITGPRARYPRLV